jgi:tetrahydromethanopterin S-methyltransferase subunit E
MNVITPSLLGLIATGMLILFFLIYVLYLVFVKNVKFPPETVLMLLLLFIIAVGIHSLQRQEVHYGLFV